MIKNKVRIEDNKVIKENNKKVIEIYELLDSRGFDSHPKIIEYDDENIKSEYIENKNFYEITKGLELIKTVSMLHYKTLQFKDVSKNKYRKIYDKISSNIEYLKKYYLEYITNIEDEIFMSPSHYLFARNYSAIDNSLKYASSTLKKWFNIVSSKSKERVCVVHNNLSLDHFIKGDKNYLISFDNSLVDTPILDLYNFYKKDGFKLDFNYLLKEYNQNMELLSEEKLLLNALISIPPKIIEVDDEYLNCRNIKNTFSYIYSSISVINENK